MRKKIKTPKSFTGGLPEICDFEGGCGGETLPLEPFLEAWCNSTNERSSTPISDRGDALEAPEQARPGGLGDFHRA